MTVIRPYADILAERLARRRSAAIAAIRAAAAVAAAHGGTIRVFGSLAEGGFDDRSDVDLIVFGCAGHDKTDLDLALRDPFEDVGIPVDIVFEDEAPDSLRARVEQTGRAADSLG